MKYLIAVAATALSVLTLNACDRQQAATPAPPVVVTVPGPAGPPGATGATGLPGAPGEKGKQGDGTVVVVPAPATQR